MLIARTLLAVWVMMVLAVPTAFAIDLNPLSAIKGAIEAAAEDRSSGDIAKDLKIKAKITADVAKRTGYYEKAQLIFKEEAPWITIAHSIVFMPMRKEVVGYKIDPLGTHSFYGVDLQ